ncbi:class D sortase [Cytobacillus firmus]|uniref:class D sortase n=1 Tax=Cytobacillus firmus TaxID=1399 RepID=UPI0021C98A40|nr:class D sortase [Cytobacillus firmus]MCU1807096.1 class D sortase [Cytobacillus firmus]
MIELKYAVLFLLLAGSVLTGYSLWQIRDSHVQTEEKKEEVMEILEASKAEPISLDFQPNETIGLLTVPKLKKDIPIIEGTDEEQLAAGVGHYPGTALPTQKDQIVLSGHRDTVFRQFDQLELGDIFTVKLPYGEFSYEIYDTKIVDADDRTIIRSTAPDEILTVTTCYPFSYLGDAPERFIFYAKPID